MGFPVNGLESIILFIMRLNTGLPKTRELQNEKYKTTDNMADSNSNSALCDLCFVINDGLKREEMFYKRQIF